MKSMSPDEPRSATCDTQIIVSSHPVMPGAPIYWRIELLTEWHSTQDILLHFWVLVRYLFTEILRVSWLWKECRVPCLSECVQPWSESGIRDFRLRDGHHKEVAMTFSILYIIILICIQGTEWRVHVSLVGCWKGVSWSLRQNFGHQGRTIPWILGSKSHYFNIFQSWR